MSSCLQDTKPKILYEPVFLYFDNILDKELFTNLQIWLGSLDYKNGYSIAGKQIPRQQIWYQENNKYFCENWKYRYDRWRSEKYNDFLKNIQNKIQEKVCSAIKEYPGIPTPNINSCLINKYRTGKDSIPPHRDCLDSFGEFPTIANFSIGDEREIMFRNNKTKETTSYLLKENSLFIMAGTSQTDYTHEILKTDSEKVRYSMTFREYLMDK
tara:strand:+ start:18 stop:653 length:636 start_codon:yes stop_codon:yes gene_type:complete